MSNHDDDKQQDRPCCPDLGDRLDPLFFKALCDPNRVAILVRLAQGGEANTVSQTAECCAVDLSVVSRHLAMLRDAGILEAEKRGKQVYYKVRYPDLAATLRAIADGIEACCPTTEEAADTPEVDNE